MIYAIKLFLAVLILNAMLAPLLRRAFDGLMTRREYWRTWIVLLGAAIVSFLSLKPVIFTIGVAVVGMLATSMFGSDAKGRLATFWLLLLVFPSVTLSTEGVGGINRLIELNHTRVISLIVLLPAALSLMGDRKLKIRSEMRWMDLFVMAYPIMKMVGSFQSSSVSNLLRTAVELLLDVLLPYYVTTRGLRTAADLKFVSVRAALGFVFLAIVGLLESVLRKNVYSELQFIYGVQWQLTHVLMRGSFIRVQSTFPVPIVMAFAMTFGLAFWTWLCPAARVGSRAKFAVFATIFLALLATWSRGPLLGALVMLLCLGGLRWVAPYKFMALLLACVAGGIALKVAGADQYVYSALQVVFGSSEADTSSIDYRKRLLDTAIALIQQSPFWGVPNYAAYMQDMKQGEGIIDLVNTYVAITLDNGLVGLFLFLLPHFVIIFSLFRRLRATAATHRRAIGSFPIVMIATTVSALVTIFTTSTFSVMSDLLLFIVAAPCAWLAMDPQEQRLADSVNELKGQLPVGKVPSGIGTAGVPTYR